MKRVPWTFVMVIGLALVAAYLAWIGPASRSRASRRSYDAGVIATAQRDRGFSHKHSSSRTLPTPTLLALVTLRHYGTRGRYLSDGKFVEGVAPNYAEATRMYDELLGRGVDVLTEYARLCEHGVPGDDDTVDPGKALRLYRQKFARCTNLYEKYDVLEHVERLSPGYAKGPVSAERARIANLLIWSRIGKKDAAPRNAASRDIVPRDVVPSARPEATAGAAGTDAPPRTVRRPATQAPARPPTIISDAHNTHDTGVTRTVKASIDKLRGSIVGSVQDPAVVVRDVRALIEAADVSDDKRDKAIQALDAIERNNATLTSTDMSEVELLSLVWTRIGHPDNAENVGALRDNLVDELSEAIEHGRPVCATGRFTRILDSLNGVDALVNVKPKWALSQEMINKAGAMFKDKVASLADDDRAAMDALDPTPEQQAAYERVMAEVKRDIQRSFDAEYVQTGIMTEEALAVETSKWISHIG